MAWSWSPAGRLDLDPILGHGCKDDAIACGTIVNHAALIELCTSAEAAS